MSGWQKIRPSREYNKIRESVMKTKSGKNFKITTIIYLLYFGLYLLIGISMLIKQPFGSPPDEYNRYLIPQYIAENGSLPNGFEEEIRIHGYGFSYGFQPILPYMLQGFCMRLTGHFTASGTALLYSARAVNLALGMVTAWIVLLLARQWFSDRRFGWLFAFLTTFLPQSIFVHTYVNTDSCCMLSIAVMLLGLTLGFKEGFSTRCCVVLSVGIILCALSYYNAYGYILSCIFLFAAFFAGYGRNMAANKPHITFDIKSFLKKGCFISALVLAGISWWFIRSAILYDGDFLGLRTRNEYAALYAVPELHPDTRVTWQSQGYSIMDMLTGSDFCNLTLLSFISMFGAMAIPTSIWVYRFYKVLFAMGLLCCIFIPLSKTALSPPILPKRRGLRIFYHANMVFCMAMPLILSIVYSYSTDYQPQGRYVLPALVPLCFYIVYGLQKACGLVSCLGQRHPAQKKASRSKIMPPRSVPYSAFCTVFCVLLCLFIVGMLLWTIYGYAFPYYEANPIAP